MIALPEVWTKCQNDITFFAFQRLHLPAASKKQRVRFSNIMEVRQLPSTQALEAKLSRMSYPAAKDHEAMLRTVGKLTITDVAKISFFFCFVVSKHQQQCHVLCHTLLNPSATVPALASCLISSSSLLWMAVLT